MKKYQVKLTQMIPDEIYGKTLAEIDPKQGISHVKVDVQDMGNIPGITRHWHYDIERRKKEINQLKNQNFIQRVSQLITSRQINSEATGEEMYSFNPTKGSRKLVETLKSEPDNMNARLELVSIVGKSGRDQSNGVFRSFVGKNGRDLSLEVFRTLLLQATTALSLGQMSTAGLQVALWVQTTYLTELFSKCKEQIEKLERKLQGTGDRSYRTPILESIIKIKSNLFIVSALLKKGAAAMGTQSSFSTTISIDELNDYLIDDKKKKELDEKLYNKYSELMLIVRFMPLLHNESNKYIDLLTRIDQTRPLPYFLKARIGMNMMHFWVSVYEAGRHDDTIIKQVQEEFKEVYHQYGLAVQRVGVNPKSQNDFTILIEYANTVHYFYKTSVNVLGVKPPKPWLEAAFAKAMKALTLAQESGKVSNLARDLHNDMVAEGMAK